MERYLERYLDEIMIDLLENTQDSIYVKDNEGRFIAVSRVKAVRSKTTWQDMVGKTDFDFMPHNEAAESWEDDVQVMTSGVPIIDKVEKITHDGMETWVSTTKTPRRNKNGEIIGIMGISRDITARHAAEEELKKTNKKILDMLRIAKHDMRAKIIAVRFLSKMLIMGRFENPLITYEEIYEKSGLLEKIINNYLDMSPYLAKQIPEQITYDITDIIEPILKELSGDIDVNNIRIDNNLGGIPGNKIIITKEAATVLEMVFRNLLVNAIKYGGGGIKIAFGCELEDKFYKFNVYNTGSFIATEDKEKIFEEGFSRGNSTGIGLSTCRSRTRSHGGDLYYEPTNEGHPNFIIRWPRNDKKGGSDNEAG